MKILPEGILPFSCHILYVKKKKAQDVVRADRGAD
jgi:hypothetical protein